MNLIFIRANPEYNKINTCILFTKISVSYLQKPDTEFNVHFTRVVNKFEL